MTSTTKIALTALLLSLVTIACAQGNDQPAVVGSPAVMGPGSPGIMGGPPSPMVIGGPAQPMSPQMRPPAMMGGYGQPMSGSPMVGSGMGGPWNPDVTEPPAKVSLDFAVTWDPSLNDMGAADVTQLLEEALNGQANQPSSVQVRQMQGTRKPVGSAPANLRAGIHVEFTVAHRNRESIDPMEQGLLGNMGKLNELMTDQAKERQTATANALNDANARLGELTGGGDNELSTLPCQIDTLNDERVVTDARVMALEEQITRMQREAAAKIDQDPMVHELGEIVKIQEKALDTAIPANVADARVKLAESRIALAQRKEAISAGTGQLAKFSSMLADLSVERAVLDKKLQAAKDKLAIRREELSKLRAEVAGLNKELEETKGFRIEKVTRKIESIPAPAQGDRPTPPLPAGQEPAGRR